MEHIVHYVNKSSELNETLQSRFRSFFVKFVFHLLLPLSGFAQENPWESQKTGSNPWPSSNPQKTESVKLDSSQTQTSNDGSRVLALNGDTIEVTTTNQRQIKKTLIQYGNDLEKSNGYFFGGLLGGSAFSLTAVPVTMLASIPNNKQSKAQIRKFKKENPEATEAEVSYVEKGLLKKRAGKAFAGAASGVLVNIGILIALVFTL